MSIYFHTFSGNVAGHSIHKIILFWSVKMQKEDRVNLINQFCWDFLCSFSSGAAEVDLVFTAPLLFQFFGSVQSGKLPDRSGLGSCRTGKCCNLKFSCTAPATNVPRPHLRGGFSCQYRLRTENKNKSFQMQMKKIVKGIL